MSADKEYLSQRRPVYESAPTVSIVTPVYNQRAYIAQTIDSVLNQTLQNWEWIVLDDGSSDGTGEVITRINDHRIHYSLQAHAGRDHLVQSYNKALAMCSSEFIALLDGDDYWPPDKLEVQVKSFDNPEVILSYGECVMVDQKGERIRYVGLPGDLGVATNHPKGSALKILLLDVLCFIYLPTVMLRTSAFRAAGGFVEAKGTGEDFPTWVGLSLKGRFAAVPACMGYYRKHPLSITARQNEGDFFDDKVTFLRDFILKNNSLLEDIGFSTNRELLERHWKILRDNRFATDMGKLERQARRLRDDRLLDAIGYSAGMDFLERHMAETKEIIVQKAYRRAMDLMEIGSFEEARAEYKRLLAQDASLRNIITYFMMIVSSLVKTNLIRPLSYLKVKLFMLLRDLVKENKK